MISRADALLAVAWCRLLAASCEGLLCVSISSDGWKRVSSPLAPIFHLEDIRAAFFPGSLLAIFFIIMFSAKVSILIKVNVGRARLRKALQASGLWP